MYRLTKRINHYCDTDIDNEYGFADEDVDTAQIVNKLGELEDLLEFYNVEDLDELDKLFEMATTYEKLSKQLGCPLKVRIKVNPGTSIYDESGNEYMVETIEKGFFIVNADIYMSFKWKDYKKTWWLRKNRSE